MKTVYDDLRKKRTTPLAIFATTAARVETPFYRECMYSLRGRDFRNDKLRKHFRHEEYKRA